MWAVAPCPRKAGSPAAAAVAASPKVPSKPMPFFSQLAVTPREWNAAAQVVDDELTPAAIPIEPKPMPLSQLRVTPGEWNAAARAVKDELTRRGPAAIPKPRPLLSTRCKPSSAPRCLTVPKASLPGAQGGSDLKIL